MRGVRQHLLGCDNISKDGFSQCGLLYHFKSPCWRDIIAATQQDWEPQNPNSTVRSNRCRNTERNQLSGRVEIGPRENSKKERQDRDKRFGQTPLTIPEVSTPQIESVKVTKKGKKQKSHDPQSPHLLRLWLSSPPSVFSVAFFQAIYRSYLPIYGPCLT